MNLRMWVGEGGGVRVGHSRCTDARLGGSFEKGARLLSNSDLIAMYVTAVEEEGRRKCTIGYLGKRPGWVCSRGKV